MKLNGKHIICSKQPDGRRMHVFEVWHSPSGGKKDDFSSRGFVEVENTDYDSTKVERQWLKANEPKAGVYTTSCLSTNLTSKFYKDWDLVLDLPDFKPI